jgi:hypothetical protein
MGAVEATPPSARSAVAADNHNTPHDDGGVVPDSSSLGVGEVRPAVSSAEHAQRAGAKYTAATHALREQPHAVLASVQSNVGQLGQAPPPSAFSLPTLVPSSKAGKARDVDRLADGNAGVEGEQQQQQQQQRRIGYSMWQRLIKGRRRVLVFEALVDVDDPEAIDLGISEGGRAGSRDWGGGWQVLRLQAQHHQQLEVPLPLRVGAARAEWHHSSRILRIVFEVVD